VPRKAATHLVLPRAAEPAVAQERIGATDEKKVRNVLSGSSERDHPSPALAAAGREGVVHHAGLQRERNDIRLAQKMPVGPCIPVRIQL
jgi:hypothetical protein